MKKNLKFFLIPLLIVLLILLPIIYQSYIKVDKSGFSKYDIKKGIDVTNSYFLAINKVDKKATKKLLSKELIERIGSGEQLEQYVNSGMNVIFNNIIITYELEEQVEEYSSLRYLYDQSTKIMYLSIEFDLEYREEQESVGAWINGHHYESFGVWLIKNDGKWKVLDWGY